MSKNVTRSNRPSGLWRFPTSNSPKRLSSTFLHQRAVSAGGRRIDRPLATREDRRARHSAFVPFHSSETDTTNVSFIAICKNREAEGVRPNTGTESKRDWLT